jgi:predicted nucleic acid-binding protein
MQIVINSSPLIFLAKLDYLDQFLAYPDDFYISQSVADEILAKSDSASQIIQAFVSSGVVQVRAVSLINLAQSLNQRLGRGESDAIVLGIELNVDYILLDDLAARKEAIRLGLTIRGTLAAINKMRRDGTIIVDSLDALYARFVEIDFRVKRSIFDQVLLND